MQLIEKINNYHDVIWGNKDTSIIFDVFSEQVKIHSPLNTLSGSNELENIVAKWFIAFPDLSVNFQDVLASDTKVVATWQATGTHQNTFLDIPKTNRFITYSGTTIYEFKDNKVAEYWAIVNLDNIKRQLI
jgi:steroid delta-isomerase-like uncharacterized protein